MIQYYEFSISRNLDFKIWIKYVIMIYVLCFILSHENVDHNIVFHISMLKTIIMSSIAFPTIIGNHL